MSVATTWQTKSEERARSFPCDRFMACFDAALYRGVAIEATLEKVFRWLCQMRIAPYSYDWIDNFGRKSPQTLTPGLDVLVPGQTFMGAFELVDFETDRHVTIRLRPGTRDSIIVGDNVISYLLLQEGADQCRLLVKMLLRYRRGPIGWFVRLLFPWGDLIMMRRQLLNFKKLAELMPTK